MEHFCACFMEGESCRQGSLFIRHEMILATPSHDSVRLDCFGPKRMIVEKKMFLTVD